MAKKKPAAAADRPIDATVPPKVRSILCEQLGLADPEVRREARLVDDFGADSLDIVEIAMDLEEAYRLPATTLEDHGADTWAGATVGDVLQTLEKAGAQLQP
jgi:acyl carrier protein